MKSTHLPSLWTSLGEVRLLNDFVRGWLAENDLAADHDGEGRPVIVLPGLFTSDARTAMARRVLRKANYRAYGWGLGFAAPVREDTLLRFGQRVDEIVTREGAPVALIGWSLGGLIAREYAKVAPEKVDKVVTLGSPIAGDPRHNRAWRAYEWAAGHSVDDMPLTVVRERKPPVETIAIWSAADGIIPPHASRGEPHMHDRAVEVSCGHLSMMNAPEALSAILTALARPSKQHRLP